MPEASSSPGPPATDATRLWRIWNSATGTAAAIVLFLVVSALWLATASTARAPVISQPPCVRQPCAALPSSGSLHVWLWLGIAGAVLIVAALVLLAWGEVGERREARAARLVRGAAAGLAGVLAEMIVVLLITHIAIVADPLGFEYSGEVAVAIAALGAAQLPLAGALALAWARLPFGSASESGPPAHPWRPGNVILGLGGMVLSCTAFAAWSLRDGVVGVVVNARLIAGTARITNVGAWWPGLFAAMVVLTLVAAACAPGVTSRAVRKVPRAPSASEDAASPVPAP